jgi:hypothetical protein
VSIPRSPTSTTRAIPNRSRIFLICVRQGLGIPSVAFEHLDRDRTALSIGQKPEDDLQLVPLAIPRVAELC